MAAELEAFGWTPGEVLSGELAADLIERTHFLVAPGTLRSFVEAQLVVAVSDTDANSCCRAASTAGSRCRAPCSRRHGNWPPTGT
jgi:hypothetical protein